MHADRWRRVEELYHAAYARPVYERGEFLDEACAGDAMLREEVESLLVQPVSADGSLERAARGEAPPTSPGRFAAGTRLGAYEIAGPLGTGGMGEVYRARDRQLNRDVALKVLPELSALDPDRLARFRREAQVLASLNHPNIGAIYGFEDADPSPGSGQPAIRALVLELVDGPTLADRIAQGPIPLQDALRIARQMCEALAAAHAQGVIHRDLKPANIKLRPDGTVKVLDFGLAKVFVGDASTSDLSQSPTVTVGGTREGVILGTAAYMSPEQARGLTVDTRTDIWAFGCVLDEMLTGRARFLGPTVTDTLAAILEREPAWDTLPGTTPQVIRRLLQRCLEKDPQQRLRDIAEARMDIEDALGGAARTGADTAIVDPTRPRVRPRWAMAIVASLIAVGTLTWYVRASFETPSVAVLPFRTIGAGDPYFANGMTEAVTTELGRVGGLVGLRVIASDSTFAYRDRTDLREIARDLGVGLVVRGSVRRADGMVRIDVSLVDPRDETALWSEGYNRKLTDVLTVQADIAREIAATLVKTFAPEPEVKSPSLTTKNPDAFDDYLRGISHLKRRSSPTPNMSDWSSQRGRVEAIAELERAVALDGNFALARATLASAYTQRFFYDDADPALDRKAFIEIRKALEINPELAQAYLARAQLMWSLGHGFPHEEAIRDLRRALAINPNLAEAHIELGKVYLHTGLTDKAVDANEQAERLDPGAASPRNRRVGALIDAARVEEVRHELERYGTRLLPQYRTDALLVLGEPKEALEVLKRRPNNDDPESDATHAALRAVVYATLGQTEDADRALAEAIPVAKNPTGLSHIHHAQFYIGSALALLRRKDEAVRWLEKAVDEGYQSYPKFLTDRSLESLKGHASFDALLARLRRDWDRWQKTL